MNLKEFKEYFENQPQGTLFKNGISEPFSWRGAYDEVAFRVEQYVEMTREQILENINKAYTGTFYGYKGGEFVYCDYTPVNFEKDTRSYTDGGYCRDLIAELTDTEKYVSEEEKMIKLAFNS